MIIDLILDRKDGKPYNPKHFYQEVLHYLPTGEGIAVALDRGEEKDVKATLKEYIRKNEYNRDICTFIQSVNWL